MIAAQDLSASIKTKLKINQYCTLKYKPRTPCAHRADNVYHALQHYYGIVTSVKNNN